MDLVLDVYKRQSAPLYWSKKIQAKKKQAKRVRYERNAQLSANYINWHEWQLMQFRMSSYTKNARKLI